MQEQLLDAEAEPPEEVSAVAAAVGLLPAAELGEEDASLAPGGGVVEAREQGPELAVGGVAGGRAPLQEGLHGGLIDGGAAGILLNADAAHDDDDGSEDRGKVRCLALLWSWIILERGSLALGLG